MQSDDIPGLEDMSLGATVAVDTILNIARQSMAQAAARKEELGGFVGFIQALVEHKEGLVTKILIDTIATKERAK